MFFFLCRNLYFLRERPWCCSPGKILALCDSNACLSLQLFNAYPFSLLSCFINHGLRVCWHTSTLLLQKSGFLLSHPATKAFVLKVTIDISKPMDARVIYYRVHDLSTALGLMDHGILFAEVDWLGSVWRFYLRRSNRLARLGGCLPKYSLMMYGDESLSFLKFCFHITSQAQQATILRNTVFWWKSFLRLMKCSWNSLLTTLYCLTGFCLQWKYFLMVINDEKSIQIPFYPFLLIPS